MVGGCLCRLDMHYIIPSACWNSRLLKARSATRTAPDDDVVALFQWMLFTSINDTIRWHVGIKISRRCRLAAVKFGGVQLNGSRRWRRCIISMNVHQQMIRVRWHVGIKISHRCRLAAVKFGGVQLERLRTIDVVALFQWMLFTSNKWYELLACRHQNQSSLSSCSSYSLEECNSNGSPTTTSLHYFNECSPAINDTSCWHVGIKISRRRLAAVKFGGVQLERLPDVDVVALFQWMFTSNKWYELLACRHQNQSSLSTCSS